MKDLAGTNIRYHRHNDKVHTENSMLCIDTMFLIWISIQNI